MTSTSTAAIDSDVLERVLQTLRHTPAGLFTDIDGTISKIATVPSEALVTESAREALQRLSERIAIAGAVTGRAADDGASMLSLHELLVVGNHGLEWLHRGERWSHPAAEASRQALVAALDEIGQEATASGLGEGVIFEDKRLSASIHYRLSPDPVETREMLLAAANGAADRHRLRITEGRFVVELRPEVVINKGTAITELVKAHGLRGVVYLGDDITDVDAFVAIKALRDQGEVETVSVAVLSPESHPTVSMMADVSVEGVDACIELLATLANALEKPHGRSDGD